jgi:hypothetical protein
MIHLRLLVFWFLFITSFVMIIASFPIAVIALHKKDLDYLNQKILSKKSK